MRLNWSKSHRLLSSFEFERCYEHGRKYYTKNFILFVKSRGDGPDRMRLGLTVSRKKGPAVVRNRIKRVMREFFRINQQKFQTRLDIVFVPKRSLDGRKISFGLAEKELLPVVERINRDLEPATQQ